MATTEHGRQAMEHLTHPIQYTRTPKRTGLEVWRDLALAVAATLVSLLIVLGVILGLAGALAIGNALNGDTPSTSDQQPASEYEIGVTD